jgi:hypothetical protein
MPGELVIAIIEVRHVATTAERAIWGIAHLPIIV